MGKKVTTELFIERAKKIHGNKYVYARAVYVSAKEPIIITCPKKGHGDWPSTASNHLHKTHPRGCPSCGGSMSYTFKTFVQQAKKVHSDSFDYPQQELNNVKTKITVICKRNRHVRQQTADSHLSGHGCKKCADIDNAAKKLVSERDINKRLQVLCKGSIGKVQLVVGSYVGMNKKAAIVCSEHGLQEERLMTTTLSGGHPCLDCAQTRHFSGYSSASAKVVLEKYFENKYHIAKFVYEGKQTPVTLSCKKHGTWTIQFSSYTTSKGCPNCLIKENIASRSKGLRRSAEATKTKRFKAWLRVCKNFHKDKYDYGNVTYVNQKTEVQIGCPYHGDIWQTPDTHKRSGCRYCADEELGGLYSQKYFLKYPERKRWPAALYYLKFSFKNHEWYKAGVTVSTLKNRFGLALAQGVSFEIINLQHTDLFSAWKSETVIQSKHGDKFRETKMLQLLDASYLRLGHSECFSKKLPLKITKQFFE